ncbi:hypothetical protein BRC68_05655 [Halobacteriales archaeon QH_6_64_20]|nr:MAG: hypothetical protein BRC68_05655 [Halobacteriales archaeon QH_6_64_20]
MATVPLHYVDLRAFSYATEDDKRVADALRYFLPEEAEIDRRVVLDRLTGLDGIDRVIDELDERVDDNCAFFLSFDKQAAYRDEVVLGDGLTLRGKIEAYPAKKETAVANLRDLLSDL